MDLVGVMRMLADLRWKRWLTGAVHTWECCVNDIKAYSSDRRLAPLASFEKSVKMRLAHTSLCACTLNCLSVKLKLSSTKQAPYEGEPVRASLARYGFPQAVIETHPE